MPFLNTKELTHLALLPLVSGRLLQVWSAAEWCHLNVDLVRPASDLLYHDGGQGSGVWSDGSILINTTIKLGWEKMIFRFKLQVELTGICLQWSLQANAEAPCLPGNGDIWRVEWSWHCDTGHWSSLVTVNTIVCSPNWHHHSSLQRLHCSSHSRLRQGEQRIFLWH